MKRPNRIYMAIQAPGYSSYWQVMDKSELTLPEYIEGKAKNTIWEHPTGYFYRRVDEKIK